jgi:hypothetical protein
MLPRYHTHSGATIGFEEVEAYGKVYGDGRGRVVKYESTTNFRNGDQLCANADCGSFRISTRGRSESSTRVVRAGN